MPGEQTEDFVDRYLRTEERLRRLAAKNRQVSIQKTWAMEGDITIRRFFPPWIIDLNLGDTTDETLQLIGVHLAVYTGICSVQLRLNEVVIERPPMPPNTAFRSAGTYTMPSYMSYMLPDPMKPVYLKPLDMLRPEIVVGNSGVAQGTAHLSVTAVMLHTPGT